MATDLNARRSRVWPAVEEFWSHLAAHVPRPEYIQLTDRSWSDAQWKAHRRATKCYEGCGVYVHYSQAGDVLYVGLTLAGFDRCWANDCDDRQYIDGLKLAS